MGTYHPLKIYKRTFGQFLINLIFSPAHLTKTLIFMLCQKKKSQERHIIVQPKQYIRIHKSVVMFISIPTVEFLRCHRCINISFRDKISDIKEARVDRKKSEVLSRLLPLMCVRSPNQKCRY